MNHSRFYAPTLRAGDAAVVLPADEGRHLTRVLRLGAGAAVRVFNGRGYECEGRVAALERENVTVAIEREVASAPEAATRITLAQAVLKGDGMDGVIRDAVMLGVAAIVPLVSAHVEGGRRGLSAGPRVTRWERIAVASAKQCGRAVVPAIAAPASLEAVLSAPAAGLRLALVEPASGIPGVSLGDLAGAGHSDGAFLFVGPEGGWAEEELRLLGACGARAITLGLRTLRAESAGLVGLSVLHTLWGEF